jgi:hypothetical protein
MTLPEGGNHWPVSDLGSSGRVKVADLCHFERGKVADLYRTSDLYRKCTLEAGCPIGPERCRDRSLLNDFWAIAERRSSSSLLEKSPYGWPARLQGKEGHPPQADERDTPRTRQRTINRTLKWAPRGPNATSPATGSPRSRGKPSVAAD